MLLKKIIAASLLPLTVLLIFLLLFENRIVIPAWLQVVGRMHPLLLHFPVVLIVLYCIWTIFIPKKAIEQNQRKQVGDWFLLLAAVSAVATALMGLFLSKEVGYDEEALLWHKWSGITIALITSLWYALRQLIEPKKWISASIAVISLTAITFAGHQGAGITHGQNFLFAPLLPEKQEQIVSIEEAVVFPHLVQPILEAKCMSCHNKKKAKGELIMESQELLLKGGKNGALWDSKEPDLGLLLRRIHLPLEQKKHMPPQGKPQLTDEETEILYQWIKGGANFTTKVLELPTTDTMRLLAEQKLQLNETASFDFDAADEKAIQRLNNSNRVVYPFALESPALGVNFYNKEFFTSDALKEILTVKDQVVSLDCSYMPLKDEDLATIGQMPNLRSLTLNFTGITGKTFGELKKLKFLRSLSVAGTAVNKEQLKQLEGFPQLRKVYIWNTAIPVAELDTMKSQRFNLVYEAGKRTDTMILKLTAPIFQNEEEVITEPLSLKLKHYINGVMIRYTVDGSVPDSLKSTLYDNKATLNSATLIKTQAYKPGWISSDVAEKYFFKSTYLPDSVELLTPPIPKTAKAELNFSRILKKAV